MKYSRRCIGLGGGCLGCCGGNCAPHCWQLATGQYIAIPQQPPGKASTTTLAPTSSTCRARTSSCRNRPSRGSCTRPNRDLTIGTYDNTHIALRESVPVRRGYSPLDHNGHTKSPRGAQRKRPQCPKTRCIALSLNWEKGNLIVRIVAIVIIGDAGDQLLRSQPDEAVLGLLILAA